MHNLRLSDALLIVILFAIFLASAGPCGQPFRDSGELLAVSQTLGVAHPPGYALYALLGKAAMPLIPCGTAGYRLNVLSAFLMAAAAAGLCGALKVLGTSPWISAATAGTACLARPNWTVATVSEPYAFMAALAAWSLRWAARGQPALAWLLAGLAICAHPFAVVLVPILLLMHRSLTCHGLTPFVWLVGVAPFLVMPIRAKTDPALSWGRTGTAAGFVQHVARAEYRGLLLTDARPVPSREPAGDVIRRFAREFSSDLTPPIAAAAVAGSALAVLWFPRPGWGLALGFLLAGPGYALAASLPDDSLSQATLLPGRMLPVWFALLASGLACSRFQARVLPAMVGGGLAGLLIFSHAPQMNRRWNFAAHDWGASLLRGVERDGIVLLAGDRNLFPVWAAQAGGGRRDVEMISPLLSRDWEVERLARRGLLPKRSTVVTAMQDLVDRARHQRPVFVKHTVGALTRLDGAPSPPPAQLRRRTAVRLPRPSAQDPYDRQIAEAMRW